MRPKIDPVQIERLHQRMSEVEAERPELGQLYERLLQEGGLAVAPIREEPDAKKIIQRGRVFSPKGARIVSGDRNRCHGNAARLYLQKRGIEIATGYALSEDEVWRQHSWGVKDGKVIETTAPRELYFGFILTPPEARLFCWVNQYLESKQND